MCGRWGNLDKFQIETKRSQLIIRVILDFGLKISTMHTSISRRLFLNYFYVHTHNFPSSKPAKSKLPTSHTECDFKARKRSQRVQDLESCLFGVDDSDETVGGGERYIFRPRIRRRR